MGELVKLTDEQVELIRATASEEMGTRVAAQQSFAATLDAPLRKGIFDNDNLDGIYAIEMVPPGAQVNYPLDFVRPGTEDLDYTAITLPKQGAVPEKRVEGDEIFVPTFTIANSIDWGLQYARDARFSVIQRAVDVYRMGFVRKTNEDGWHVILAAADARGLVVVDDVAQNGQFTKELVAKMQTSMTRNAGGNGGEGRLTDVYTSMEAMEDIRAWDISEIDDITRREILTSSPQGLAKLYNTVLHFMTEFGVGQEYQTYMSSTLSRSVTGGDAGDQEFCIGVDKSTNDSFVRPIREELQTFDDPNLHRSQRAGIYGWMTHGLACVDNRRVLIGTF